MFKKFSTRFFSLILTLILTLTIFPAYNVGAISYEPTSISHWGYAYNNTLVYDENKSATGGMIYGGEGFTILDWGTFPDGTYNFKVEYSTSNGPRHGFVLESAVHADYRWSSGAKVVTSATVWYSINPVVYAVTGSVSSGETVCVLAETGGWSYIEYNTNSGRKRGWCASSCISKVGTQYLALGTDYFLEETSVNQYNYYYYHTVYAGPGVNYYSVGSIGTSTQSEGVNVISKITLNTGTWAYISYYSTTLDKYKTGYIQI